MASTPSAKDKDIGEAEPVPEAEGQQLIEADQDQRVEDQDVDDEFVALVKERPNVVLVPNMPNRGVPTDLDWLNGSMPAAELAEMQAAATERPEAQAAFAIDRRQLAFPPLRRR